MQLTKQVHIPGVLRFGRAAPLLILSVYLLSMGLLPIAAAQETSSEGAPSEGALTGHAGPVWDVTWSPDGTRLASAGEDGAVRIWAQTGGVWETARALAGHEGGVTAVDWSPDGARVASAGKDGMVRLWDTASGGEVAALPVEGGPAWDVAWSPGGGQLATAGVDGAVRLWDVETGAAQATLEGHAGEAWAVAWSPDGTRLASGGLDGVVRVWTADTGAALFALTGHAGPVWDVAWSPDGNRIASGGVDGAVRTWEADTGAALATLRGHSGDVNAVAWSPVAPGAQESAYVASGSIDKTVAVWTVGGIEGKRAALMENAAYVTGLAWSAAMPVAASATSTPASDEAVSAPPPTFSRLAGAGYDGVIQVWDFFTTVQAAGGAADATAVPALATATPAPRVICTAVTSNNVNLRAGPSTDFVSLGLAPTGTAVNAVGQNAFGDWYQVENPVTQDGSLAWIAGFLLSELSCPQGESLPVAE